MGSLNKVQLIGNLGRDAELRYTPGGQPVASFNMATTETWNDKSGQKQERTEWHRIVTWGKTSEALAEYLVKGKQVYVEGKLQTRSWEDKDGVKRYTTEIRSDRIVLLGGGPRNQAPHPAETADEAVGVGAGAGAAADVPIDDDIPFAWLMPFVGPILAAGLVARVLWT